MDEIKNFDEAHYSKNYWWIFTELDKNEDGYVKPRN
jgi:hypothetical protein